MIDKLTYDQILQISKELKLQIEIVNKIAVEKGIPEINDFTSTVEGYTKFLENTVEINKDADIALQELKNSVNK